MSQFIDINSFLQSLLLEISYYLQTNQTLCPDNLDYFMYSSSISFLSFDSSYKKILFYLHFLNYNSLRAILDISNVKNIVQIGILHSISHLLQLGIVLSDTL